MKWLALLGLIAIASAQSRFSVQSSNGDFKLQATDGSVVTLDKNVFRATLISRGGQVYAASKAQGLELFAGRAVVEASSADGKQASVRSATGTGGVRVVKTGGGGRSEMTGATATYKPSGNTATLTVTGSVRLANSNSKASQDVVATGSGLTALLDASNNDRPLRAATLGGPVKVQARQAAVGGQKAGNLLVTGNRLVYDNTGAQAKLTISGGVKMNGLQSGLSFSGSVGTVVLYLNSANEVVRTDFNGGAR